MKYDICHEWSGFLRARVRSLAFFLQINKKGVRKGRILDQLSIEIIHFTTEITENTERFIDLCAL